MKTPTKAVKVLALGTELVFDPEEIQKDIKGGNFISLIRFYRQLSGFGLKETAEIIAPIINSKTNERKIDSDKIWKAFLALPAVASAYNHPVYPQKKNNRPAILFNDTKPGIYTYYRLRDNRGVCFGEALGNLDNAIARRSMYGDPQNYKIVRITEETLEV
jgi:hypothetical protein